MNENNKIILELLLKKWELLWNHYKLQDEMMEKRRNLLWIIQSFIFAAWYYSFLKSVECIETFKLLSLFIPFFGIFVNIVLLIVLSRHFISLLIDEQALRDVEFQFNTLPECVKMDRFIIDRDVLFNGKSHRWIYNVDECIDEHKHIRYSSQRLWLNNAIPTSFIIIWIILVWLVLKEYFL